MVNLKNEDRNRFFYARDRYHGQVKPENLVFNANLQEFAQRVGYITSLETNGKISSEKAFNEIDALWENLAASKQNLRIGNDLFP